MNLNNYKIGTGRLTTDIKVFPNSDGSQKIRFTLAEVNDYKEKDGNRASQFIPYEAFIPASKNGDLGVYARMHEGDLVTVQATAKNNNYTDPDTGAKVYGIVLQVEKVKLLESKDITDARQTYKAAVRNKKAADSAALSNK